MAGPGRPKKYPDEPKQGEQIEPVALPENPISGAENADMEIITENFPDSAPTNATSIENVPPIEQKIQSLTEKTGESFDGWHEIGELSYTNPPRNGMPVYVCDAAKEKRTLVYWKKTRAFANATRTWELTGKWIDNMSGLAIDFTPKYWKERYV
jgi:hypothetical protein